jgi:hypothetical protein
MSPARPLTVLLASALLTVLAAGCGGKPSLSGTVTYDGQPVDGGSSTLYPAAGKDAAAGGRIQGGQYTVVGGEKLTPGTYKVHISWLKATGKKIKDPSDPGVEIAETKEVIPAEYNEASKLTTEITSGSTTANFDLKAGGAPPAPGPVGAPKPGAKKKSSSDT